MSIEEKPHSSTPSMAAMISAGVSSKSSAIQMRPCKVPNCRGLRSTTLGGTSRATSSPRDVTTISAPWCAWRRCRADGHRAGGGGLEIRTSFIPSCLRRGDGHRAGGGGLKIRTSFIPSCLRRQASTEGLRLAACAGVTDIVKATAGLKFAPAFNRHACAGVTGFVQAEATVRRRGERIGNVWLDFTRPAASPPSSDPPKPASKRRAPPWSRHRGGPCGPWSCGGG